MKIWAHRGCSQRYPENTLLAFEKAAAVSGLTGIELDIQLTRDGEMVVIHDERVDRTTEGMGYVRDYTLSQIKKLHIYADDKPSQEVPTITEVLDLLTSQMKAGLKLNIELNSRVSDCLYKLRGGCGAAALHPFWRGMDLKAQELEGYVVRVWMSGHLYPEKPTGTKLDFGPLEAQGITDIILNEPEVYL